MAFEFSKSKLPLQLFINNEYVDSKNSKKLTLHNPKDGSLISDKVPLGGEHDVDAAVAAAEKAFPVWKKFTGAQRRTVMNKFAELIEKNGIALAELTRITLGAPYEAFGKFEAGMCAEVYSLRIWSSMGRSTITDDYDRHLDTTPAGLTSSEASPGHRRTGS